MGAQYDARCQKCGHSFSVSQGGGFSFHLLRCDKCGKEKSIGFEGAPLGEAEAEALLGKHRCGGRFRFEAPARCPKCRSTEIECDENGPNLMYD